MSLTIYDIFGNVVSVSLLILIPITSRFNNFLIKKTAEFDGYSKEEKDTYKVYMSYSRSFSLLFTSLLFGLSNSFYLMLKDELKWEYVIFGFFIIILLFMLFALYTLLNPYNIDQNFTQYIYQRYDCSFNIEDSQSFPIWAKIFWHLNPMRMLIFASALSYVIPSVLVISRVL